MSRQAFEPCVLMQAFVNPVRRGGYCPFHHHREAEIVYHPSGSGVTTTRDGQRFEYTPGAVVIYPPWTLHDQRASQAGEDLCIRFAIEDPDLAADVAMLCLPRVSDAFARHELEALPRAAPARDRRQQRIRNHRLSALLLTLLNEAALLQRRASLGTTAGYANEARWYISEHFGEIRSLAIIADVLDISYDYLRHIFRKEYGQCLKDHLQETRVTRAKELLRYTPTPIKAVAAACGFGTERYFCTCFKARTGLTPGAYRAGAG